MPAERPGKNRAQLFVAKDVFGPKNVQNQAIIPSYTRKNAVASIKCHILSPCSVFAVRVAPKARELITHRQ